MLDAFGHRAANFDWELPALGAEGAVRLIPVSQDLLRLFDLFLRAGEVKFEFSGSACDVHFEVSLRSHMNPVLVKKALEQILNPDVLWPSGTECC
jgi:hypothetical protein